MTNLAAYRPYWHPIAMSEEVTDSPRRFTLLDEHLVAFRAGGRAAVLKDLCIHRGSALSLGQVVDGRIECPYHGWQYDADGACVKIPALPEGHSIPRKARAQAYQVREEAGLVWVALDEPVAPFPEWPEACRFGDDRYRSHVVAAYDWTVGAGRAVENFLDVAHFPFVHEELLGFRESPLVSEHDIDHDEFSMHYFYSTVQAKPEGGREKVSLEYFYHVPLTCHLKRQVPDGRWLCVSLLPCPVSAGTSRLFVTCVRDADLDPEYDAVYSRFLDDVFNQDKAVVSSVRPEEIPVDLREELHLKVPDAAGLLLRRYLGRIDGVGTVA
ncbi:MULTISPECIES: aromatic ring-hydroxylating oxygenase subunit alpha [Actinomadura]|uniref:Aromatic ring-hydroxylating dioxygenase subunit alpha n=1 Tax=Actinomadura geliboluensis TaxID=882440 RepID=A0A5S4HAV6_9ACTN|nr:aromatic ring-hydroxylating dioxygenase subunit alpha [Actinomadura geliboluensis]TMR42385.1 aromatic ring-hydroxylating dioxygenase subunit alpha [Actinomadura geliboluensis]